MSNTTTQKSTLPASSLLNKTDQQYDYVDSYSSVIELHRQSLRIEDVGKAFFSAPPSWVDNLFVIRDRIVRERLKTSENGVGRANLQDDQIQPSLPDRPE